MDLKTTLADLLALNLHECEEEVKNIVDKAVKEMSMEKILRELHTTWSKMEFEQELHTRTGCILLKASEELIETLEDNQVLIFFPLVLDFFFNPLSTGPATESDHFQIHRTLFRRSLFVATETKHRGSSHYSLVWSPTDVDALGIDFYELGGYSDAVTARRGAIQQHWSGV